MFASSLDSFEANRFGPWGPTGRPHVVGFWLWDPSGPLPLPTFEDRRTGDVYGHPPLVEITQITLKQPFNNRYATSLSLRVSRGRRMKEGSLDIILNMED